MDNLPNELLQLIISYLDDMTKFHLYRTARLLTIQRKYNPLHVINKEHNNYNLVKCNSLVVKPSVLETHNMVLYSTITILRNYYVNIPKYSDNIKKLVIANTNISINKFPSYLEILRILDEGNIKKLPTFPKTLKSLTIKSECCPELFLPNSLKFLDINNCQKIHYPNNLQILKFMNCSIDNLPQSIHTIHFPNKFIDTGLNLIKASHTGNPTYPNSIKKLTIWNKIDNVTFPPLIIKLTIDASSTFDVPLSLKKLVLLNCSDTFFQIYDVECVIYYAGNILTNQYIDHYQICQGQCDIDYLMIVNNDVKGCTIFAMSEVVIKEGIEDLSILLSCPTLIIPESVKKLKLVFSPTKTFFDVPPSDSSRTNTPFTRILSFLNEIEQNSQHHHKKNNPKFYKFIMSENIDYSMEFTKVTIKLPKQLRHLIVNCNENYPIEWSTPSNLLICNSMGNTKVIIPAKFIKI